jgi:hypothetical protein
MRVVFTHYKYRSRGACPKQESFTNHTLSA